MVYTSFLRLLAGGAERVLIWRSNPEGRWRLAGLGAV